MDTREVAGIILGAIGTVLGLVNFFFGANIYGRLRRVKVTDCDVQFDLRALKRFKVSRDLGGPVMQVRLRLVLTSEKRECYVKKEARVDFNRHLTPYLYPFFTRRSKVHVELNDSDSPTRSVGMVRIPDGESQIKLVPNKEKTLVAVQELACGQRYRQLAEGLADGSADAKDEYGKIADIVNKLEEEYQVTWTYSDGSSQTYRVPHQWYHWQLTKRFWSLK